MSTQSSSSMAVDRRADAGVDVHGDRPGDAEPVERVDQVPAENPESARSVNGPVAPARRTRAMSSSTKRLCAALGGALAHPGMQHLAGVGPGGQQRVVAESTGVAVGGAVFGFAVHLADRRVQIDRHRRAAGPGARRPGPPDRLGDHGVELADVTEGERAQERAQRRRRHHPERQHPLGRPGAQPVSVIDVVAAGQDRGHQRQHLAARPGAADPTDQAHLLVDQRFQPEPGHQRRRHDQPGIGDQRLVIEDRLDAVDHVRYWRHWKCLPSWSTMTT